MSQAVGVVDIYDVGLAPDNRVRLSMILRAASFPDCSVDFAPEVAIRIGKALLSVGQYAAGRALPGNQAAGCAHGS